MGSSVRMMSLMAAHCVAICFGTAQSQTYPLVHGAGPVREEQLAEALVIGAPNGIDEVRTFILEWYRGNGYYRTTIDSIGQGEGRDEIWLTEGRPTVLRRLTLSGISADLERRILGVMVQREGETFIEDDLRQDIARILDLLGADGLLSVTVTRGDMSEEEDESSYFLSVELMIEVGDRSIVEYVEFEGLDETRPSTAAMLSRIDAGDAWSERIGAAARRRLSRTRIFSDVSPPVLRMAGPERVVVGFRVREGRPNSFDGIIGYLPPPSPSGSGTVSGLIDLQFGNLFGTARRLHARWYQERQMRHEIEVGYREPSIAGWPVAGDAGLFQRRQDSTYVRLEGSLALEAEVRMDMFAALTVSRSTTTPVEGYGQSVLPASEATFLGGRFEYDTRDRPIAATTGLFYRTALEAGRKSSSGGGVSSATGIQKISFDTEYFHPIANFQTLAVMLHWRQVSGDGLDIADLYRLGGSTTLRGYRENEFAGSRIIWQTTEYRFFLSPSSYLGVFADLASVHVSGVRGIDALDIFRAGYGITSLIRSPIGSVGLSIAMGDGDAIGDAKLHVRLRTEF